MLWWWWQWLRRQCCLRMLGGCLASWHGIVWQKDLKPEQNASWVPQDWWQVTDLHTSKRSQQ
jgi:hypothetical protein